MPRSTSATSPGPCSPPRDPQLRAAGLTVRADLASAVTVRGAGRLHQVLGNLLANTARYCRPGDEVTLVVRAEAETAVAEVRDTGPGIPPDDLPHVFDRFWRGAAARSVPGSGLGLAVVRELVTAHGGTVQAASPPSGGSVFTVRLPAADGATSRRPQAISQAPST